MKYFDEEEKELIESIENGVNQVDSVANLEEEKARYQEIFAKNFSKRKAISLRILESDLFDLKSRALEEGIPYQTLINSILHKYLKGSLNQKS